MAKISLKKEQTIFNDNINKRQHMATMDYSIYFTDKPTFVTYYHQNFKQSTIESSLDSTIGLLGKDSSIRFDIINDLPIYQFQGIDSVNVEDTDFGSDTSVEGNGIIIPHLIDPYPEDFFTINYDNEHHLFQVTDVKSDKITGAKFYSISFILDHRTVEELLDRKSTKEFTVDYDNIGTGHNPVIAENDRILIDSLVNTHMDLLLFVTDYLYHKDLNYIYFTDSSNRKIYDPMLNIFTNNNNILIPLKIKDIYNAIYLDRIDIGKEDHRLFYTKLYDKTLYWAIENKNGSNIQYVNFMSLFNTKKNRLNWDHEDNMITSYYGNLGSNPYVLYDSALINNIQNNILYADNIHMFEDFIIKYINNNIDKNNIIDELEMLEFDDDYKGLYNIMIIIYIIKKIYNNMLLL